MMILTMVLSLLKKYWLEIVAAILIFSAVIYATHSAQNWCNKACKNEREQRIELEHREVRLLASIKDAQDRASALALLWANKVNETEVKFNAAKEQTLDVFRKLDQRRGTVNTSGTSMRITPDTRRLLNDATEAANRVQDPTATGGGKDATITIPPTAKGDTSTLINENDYTASWIEAAKAYSSCKVAWAACVEAYSIIEKSDNRITQDLQSK